MASVHLSQLRRPASEFQRIKRRVTHRQLLARFDVATGYQVEASSRLQVGLVTGQRLIHVPTYGKQVEVGGAAKFVAATNGEVMIERLLKVIERRVSQQTCGNPADLPLVIGENVRAGWDPAAREHAYSMYLRGAQTDEYAFVGKWF